jgi:leader peptidase (prepilin peptidase)/N-methyltransferase
MSEAEASVLSDQQALDSANLRPNLLVLAFGTLVVALLSVAFLPWFTALFATILGALMIAGADVDARTLLLPDTATLGAIVAGVAFAPFAGDQSAWTSLSDAALRALAVAAALLSLRVSYEWVRGQEGLGLGDVKLGGAIGAWLPLERAPICFALAAMTALAFVVARRRRQPIDGDVKLPFGAFLCPSLWLIFFFNALPN